MQAGTIVVTGASSGFGRATVERFAAGGWRVAAAVRRPDECRALFAGQPNVLLLPLDVTDQGAVDLLAAAVHERYGAVDLLVNNAGVFQVGPLETTSMEQVRALYETNVFGLMRVTKAFVPTMRARRSGMIVNIASASALANSPFLGAYGSSKWAVAGLSEALAVELAPFGIRVKTIFPGVHATRIFVSGVAGAADGGAEAAAAYRAYLANFLALRDGAPNAPSPRAVARLVWRAAHGGGGRTRYVTGPDARLTALLKALLPQRAFKALLVAGIARPPSRLTLRLAGLLMRGEPLDLPPHTPPHG
jgi:NAD(P)-dependent dehydrogenase (short-subunit alcohol dehydrogenase family)